MSTTEGSSFGCPQFFLLCVASCGLSIRLLRRQKHQPGDRQPKTPPRQLQVSFSYLRATTKKAGARKTKPELSRTFTCTRIASARRMPSLRSPKILRCTGLAQDSAQPSTKHYPKTVHPHEASTYAPKATYCHRQREPRYMMLQSMNFHTALYICRSDLYSHPFTPMRHSPFSHAFQGVRQDVRCHAVSLVCSCLPRIWVLRWP